MRDLELVTNILVTKKMQAELRLEKIINDRTSYGSDVQSKCDDIQEALREVKEIMGDIQLWEQYMNQIPSSTQQTVVGGNLNTSDVLNQDNDRVNTESDNNY